MGNMRQKTILLGLLLVLVTLLLYGSVIHHEFLSFDDRQYVVRNPHVNTGLSFNNFVWACTTFDQANWHPVTWLSHMLDCQLFGLNSGAHHLVNLMLHAANALLLFLLLRRATGATLRSFLVALFFAIHPLNVETVAWLAERKSLLSMFFSLLTLGFYGWYAGHRGWPRYLLVAFSFALALMAKPMAVTLPIVLLLLDYWPLARYADLPFSRRGARLLLEKLPLLALSGASSVVTLVAQRSFGSVVDVSSLPLSLRLGNAVVSYVAYIQKALWPARLAIFYPHPQNSLLSADVIAAALILLAITAAVLYLYRLPYLATGWFLFVVTLIPVIGIIQVGRQAMADRYTYVPCIGLFLIIVWGLGDLVASAAIPRAVPVLAALCVSIGLAAATVHDLSHWHDGVKLFTQASIVAGQPDPAIEEALADALVADHHYDEAYAHYAEACTLRPMDALCHFNLAEILFNRHQLHDALDQYQIAASLPDGKGMLLPCLLNTAEILLDLGDYPSAETRLSSALEIDPNNKTALQLRQRMAAKRKLDQTRLN